MILDTNALLWLSQDNPDLGRRARVALNEASAADSLRFSSISMLEVARLHHDGRINLRRPPEVWHRELLDQGVREVPVTSRIAMLAATLRARDSFHADPADQLITATALATRDELLTSTSGSSTGPPADANLSRLTPGIDTPRTPGTGPGSAVRGVRTAGPAVR